ncbi:zinc-binding alcohol dehydrogenase family protein [Leptotrichia wadei]|uniref:zinc-binding alcohol dehydrogenase family protein n=1 Tax=Leptotrichia wadei TaxID=157687 RepID=UPI0028E82FB7|nr:zinc-binding alcohol dehydrogenase family protein [Leptotrichia wadei]
MKRRFMKAMVLEKPCSAEEMKIKNVPIPEVKKDWILVKIKAFGINRAEIFTRQGDSPSVKLPRVIGIECVGIVEDPSNSDFKKGDKVFSMMNGMGREFDGSYAEYILIPKNQVYRLPNEKSFFKNIDNIELKNKEQLKEKFSKNLEITEENIFWSEIAAYPELYYTAYGSLFKSLKLKEGETLLVRGGTGSVALAAIQLAKAINVRIIATSRSASKEQFLKEKGADEVIVGNENFDENLKKLFPDGVDKVLELIGRPTLKSSLKSVKQGGIVCMTGCLGGWIIEDFEPLVDIISESYLTSFDSTNVNKNTIKEMFEFIEKYNIKPCISKIFTLDEISLAHKYLESNSANGKVIIMTEQ